MEQRPYVIGHRGIAAVYPENTLISFEKAIEWGVDAIEFDVHFSRDRKLVIAHDHTIDRCSTGSGNLADFTLEELRKFDFGVKKGTEFAGTQIPTLEETLDAIYGLRPGMPLLVELKDDNDDCTRAIVKELLRREFLDTTLVLSFHPRQLNLVHELLPEVKLQGFPRRYLKPDCTAEFNHIDKTCIWLREVTAEEIDECHAQGLLVDTCPVDTIEHLEKALSLDLDSFTTNAAHVIIPALKAMGRR